MSRERSPESKRERTFRWLTRLYPTRFRDEFEDEMHAVLRADHSRRAGGLAVAGFWLRALAATLREALREHLADLGGDLRLALRSLRRRPLFVTISALSMGSAIGAATVTVATLSSLFLEPIAGIGNQDRLINVKPYSSQLEGWDSASYPDFQDLRAATTTLADLAGFRGTTLTAVSAPGAEPEPFLGQLVTPNYFAVLGVQAMHGRLFTAEEEFTAASVVVVSDWFWRNQLQSELPLPELRVNGQTLRVVGVGPPGFRGNFKGFVSDLFLPQGMAALVGPQTDGQRDARTLELVGLLAPKVHRSEAAAEMTRLGELMTANHPEINNDLSLHIEPMTGLDSDFRTGLLTFLVVLLCATLLILVVAALNVSGMIAGRAAQRANEMAVRQALGAPRHRLRRQGLVETLVLSLLAAGFGFGLAWWGVGKVGTAFQTVDSRISIDVSLNVVSLSAALGMALLVMLLAERAAAVVSMRGSLVQSQRGTSQKQSWRRALVLGQVVLSFAILVTAALFLRALGEARNVDLGFEPQGVAVASLNPSLARMTQEDSQRFFAGLREEVAALTEVEQAGLITTVPLSLGARFFANRVLVNVSGHQPPADQQGFAIESTSVSAGAFEALGLELARGRPIDRRDGAESAPVVLVNETFAQRFFSGREALDSIVVVEGIEHRIVGVARDSKYRRLDEPPTPFVYRSFEQVMPGRATLLAKARTNRPETALATIRSVHRSLAPGLPVRELEPLDRRLASTLLPQRAGAAATGALGILGLLLSAMGITGVLAQWVESRRREIGLRVSVGATRQQILFLVLRQASRLTLLGILAGVPIAWALSAALRGFLYGVSPLDPLVYVAVAGGLLGAALVASTVPALRAVRVDPLTALRAE